ncbi:MAG: hypothetical protein JW804_09275 [Sedimentisphaerales bacterium]|nr:hypothetical protein [Sedimentisphaerales bacterium]
MKLPKRKPTGREKDEESIKLLEELREKLHCDNSSVARRAAFELSWKQEDGIEILGEALFSKSSLRAKSAACYGLRNMHGRMRKLSMIVINKGAESNDRNIRQTCKKALELIEQSPSRRSKPKKKHKEKKYEIREVRPRRHKKPKRRVSHTSPREMGYQSRRNFNR